MKDEKKVFFDSLFKYCINEKKQNIIFYILNQGYDIFSALQDSIECNQLNFSIALTERINENNIKKLQQKNSNGQSLLHILSMKSNSDKDLIEQLYNILVSKVNINISDYDNKGHTPLYYACLSNNFKMIELLTNKNKLNKNFLDDADKKNTPLEILYKNIKEEISEIPELVFNISKELKIGNLNCITLYLSKNYTKDMKNEFSYSKMNNNINNSNYVNKIIAIYELLINECNVDIMELDENSYDSFTYCVLEDNPDFMFDILLKEKNVKYDQVNKDGKSFIHFLISPDGISSYQNEKFLEKAIETGFKIDIKDNNNKTPLDYAIEYHYEKFVKILLRELNKNEKKDLNDIEMKNDIQTEIISKYNYEEDSENYYKNTIQPYMNQKLLESQKDILKTLVTKNCNLKRKNYRICTDENNIPYNIDLSKVDINRFQYGEFLFYKIQLLHNIKRNMFNLITRWGRFGQVG